MELSNPELKELEPSKAEAIKKTFEPMVKMLENFEESYSKIVVESEKDITPEIVTDAKRIRLDIGKIRIEADKVRKSQKEEYLRAGKAIDGAFNILKWAVVEKEDKLKAIENHFEELEKLRLEKIAQEKESLQTERVKLISEFVDDAAERDLSSMDPDVWDAFLNAKKQAMADKIQAEKEAAEKLEKDRIEAEKLAEEKRLKDIETAKIQAKKEAEEQLEKEKEKARLKAIQDEKAKIQAEKDATEKLEVEKQKAIDAENKKMDNLKHVQKIHKDAKDAIVKLGVDDSLSVLIVKAIKAGDIPNVSIKY